MAQGIFVEQQPPLMPADIPALMEVAHLGRHGATDPVGEGRI
jgi:hypothetical protein